MVSELIGGFEGEYFKASDVKRVKLVSRYVEDTTFGVPSSGNLEVYWQVQVNLTGAEKDWFAVFDADDKAEAQRFLDDEIRSRVPG